MVPLVASITLVWVFLGVAGAQFGKAPNPAAPSRMRTEKVHLYTFTHTIQRRLAIYNPYTTHHSPLDPTH